MADVAYSTAPFDHAKADIILRSSDNIDFRVFKLFLSLASPFFETLFDIPQPAKPNEDQEVRDGLVVVPVAEDSKTLDALLRFCYPCTLADDPKLEVLKDAVDVLEAARKYSLDSIEKKARQAISNPKILEAEPLRCFVIAHQGRLREETLLAAKYTLTQPLIPSWFQEIELITATDLLSLLTYHQRCGRAAHALRGDLSWITSHYAGYEACAWLFGRTRNSRCSCPKATTSKYILFSSQHSSDEGVIYSSQNSQSPPGVQPLPWWEDFMEETFTVLQDKPCKETVRATAAKAVQTVKGRGCQVCSATITENMRDFSDLFVRKVEEAVSLIELQLEF